MAESQTKRIVPLGLLPVGTRAIIHTVQGGRGIVSRLATLGFIPGAEVVMVQNLGHGPLIVSVRDTRIALGRGEANKVFVLADGNVESKGGLV